VNADDIRKIDELYVCQRCSMAFLFKDDIEGHRKRTGHREILYTSLDSLR